MCETPKQCANTFIKRETSTLHLKPVAQKSLRCFAKTSKRTTTHFPT